MTPKEWKGLLRVAKDNVPFGIYAVEKGNYGELTNILPKDEKALRKQIRALKKEGFGVYWNA